LVSPGNQPSIDLKQSDLPEIGSRGVISEMLSGKGQLNVRQIKLLSKKFKRLFERIIGKDRAEKATPWIQPFHAMALGS
jgi:hypothetical protein